LAQALYRRLITTRGTLQAGHPDFARGEDTYGLDIAGFIGDVGDEAAVIALPGRVRAELLKDDRVRSVDVTASVARASNGESEISLVINVDPIDDAESFALTLSVTEARALLLGITL
jgi:hypothetical protein